MLKNLKMALKMSLGFGAVIVLVTIVGGLAVFNMFQIRTQANLLTNEYVPEVAIASGLEKDSLLVMYNARGYGLTGQAGYLDDARGWLEEVDLRLREADDLNNRATALTMLGQQVSAARQAISEYTTALNETEALTGRIQEIQGAMDTAAGRFVQASGDFLDSMNASFLREVRAGASAAALTERHRKITLANDIIDHGNALRVANFRTQATDDVSYVRDALDGLDEINALISELRTITRLDADLREIDTVETAAANYGNEINRFLQAQTQRNELNTRRNGLAETVLEAAATTAEAGITGTQRIANETTERVGLATTVVIAGISIALILAVIIAFVITQAITKPLYKGVEFATELSKGNLAAQLSVSQRDEIGVLADAMRDMTAKLTDVVRNVQSASQNVSSGSQQMSSTAQELSQGATEQAASTEEVSSSMEEMSSNIRQNADNSLQTDKIATQSAQNAEEGGRAVAQTVGAMKEIADKISIIEEIARQTNLLALNAAIEAARAGEHGKGFAVVASEVRKLAERSQKAAGEIGELSQNSVSIAEQAGEMLKKLVPDIQKTAELVQEISASSAEQNSGADQINKAILQLDQVVQQNASASEEMASMAEELSSQAENLQETISFFRIKNEQRRLPGPNVAGPGNSGNGNDTNKKRKPAQKSGHGTDSPAVTQHPRKTGIALALEDGSADSQDTNDTEFEEF
jgi:methyl-accepting chemotaxis protein